MNDEINILREVIKNGKAIARAEEQMESLGEKVETLFRLWNNRNLLKNIMLTTSIVGTVVLIIWNLKLLGVW